MLMLHDPMDWVTVIEQRTCEHHKRQPWDTSWPGCTCSTSYSQRRATPEERAANIKARDAENERRRKHMADYDAGRLK